jgi:hypothetical protein
MTLGHNSSLEYGRVHNDDTENVSLFFRSLPPKCKSETPHSPLSVRIGCPRLQSLRICDTSRANRPYLFQLYKFSSCFVESECVTQAQ